MNKQDHILIIGAGLCGSLLALRLAQRGYKVDVYESRPDLRTTDISAGDAAGTGAQSTSGFEVTWDYYDLMFSYGDYTNTLGNDTGHAQAFKIQYKVSF